MVYVLYALFFTSCVLLVGTVLLQPGKTDAGALFTSNISSSALAPRGTATILSKLTIMAAAVFMVSALLLSMPALNGNVSVLSSNPDAPAESPAANTDANSNSAVPVGSDANANGALIQTPATEQVSEQAANAQAAAAKNTNVAVLAPANAKPAAKPATSPAKK